MNQPKNSSQKERRHTPGDVHLISVKTGVHRPQKAHFDRFLVKNALSTNLRQATLEKPFGKLRREIDP